MFAATKDPQAVLDYYVDWSKWLPSGAAIAAHQVAATGGIRVDSSSVIDGSTVKLWLSGGAAGRASHVTVEVTDSEGRKDQRSIRVWVADR